MNIGKKMKRGFTLVELMIVVAIVGVLAALAIYGVRKYVLNAKTAEARNSIGRMAKDASTAFNREKMDGAVLALGGTSDVGHSLCGAAAATVPASKASIAGAKYQSTPTDWAGDDQETGWTCLRFSMQEPQYFMYDYNVNSLDFQSVAQGDLDGDGVLSTFTLAGKVDTTDSAGAVVVIAPAVDESNPEE